MAGGVIPVVRHTNANVIFLNARLISVRRVRL